MLCAGAPQHLRDKLCLGKPDDYRVSYIKMTVRAFICQCQLRLLKNTLDYLIYDL